MKCTMNTVKCRALSDTTHAVVMIDNNQLPNHQSEAADVVES